MYVNSWMEGTYGYNLAAEAGQPARLVYVIKYTYQKLAKLIVWDIPGLPN